MRDLTAEGTAPDVQLLNTTAPFQGSSPHGGLVNLWRDDLKTLNPYARVEIRDEEFKALRRELRTLSLPWNEVLLRLFLTTEWVLELEEDCAESDEPNAGLTVLSAGCRLGFFQVRSGEWTRSAFGASFAEAWPSKSTPLELFTRCWSPRLVSHLRQSVRWGWFALRDEPACRAVLERIVAAPVGLTHYNLIGDIRDGDSDAAALRGIAAAAAIGAARFTGWRWEPTMFGTYLLDDPNSWLNTRSPHGF